MRIDKRMLEDIPAWFARQDDIPGGWLDPRHSQSMLDIRLEITL